MADEAKGRLIASFTASAAAEACTVPIDTTKVRLQVQNTGGAGAYKGMGDAMRQIVRNEGAIALFKGFTPALLRQCTYTPMMMVLYEPIKRIFTPDGQTPGYFARLVSAGTAGAIGIAFMNPTEILKTQMQSNRTARLTMASVARSVYQKEGIKGFWAGIKPNIVRTFLVNAAEIGTYDQAKHTLVRYGMVDPGTLGQHVSASFIAGLFSAMVSTPADVVKTRLMNQAGHAHKYNGMIHAAMSIPKEEGFFALYKGFVPILTRKVVWCSVFFVVYERVYKIAVPDSKKDSM